MRDRPQRTEVLESFPAPILIVGGEQDTLVPKDDLVAQSKRIPFLTFRSLTSVGHMGFYEAEEKALQAIEEFMLIVSNGEA
jgi:pimeloyl-ACP methyl ester carboxylesterase